MNDYRLYLLDGEGHIADAVEFHAPSDDEAILQAAETKAPGGVELWSRGRMVRTFPQSATAGVDA